MNKPNQFPLEADEKQTLVVLALLAVVCAIWGLDGLQWALLAILLGGTR